MRRFLVLLLCLPATAFSYYYYVQYNSRTAPFNPVVEKFDLNALNNKTVPVLISDQSPILGPGDSYLAVVSEVRAAAKVWNDVTTSDLRLAYAGLVSNGTLSNSPSIEVDFSDDIPPGLVAYTGQDVRTAISGPAAFIPIQQSHIVLKRDLSGSPGPSYSEFFFTTLVHEFGHAVGLQHTLTSSVMATSTTNASTKAAPLAADDIAGLSLLYPAAGYLAGTGSISGRVTLNGNGVNLASVVAISTNSAAISALTNPDGTFQIDGLPPQQYYVYVQPLPTAQQGEASSAGINPPVDSRGAVFPAATSFVGQFYSGTRDFNQAQWVFVYQGNVTSGTNFTVANRTGIPLSPVLLYGYTQTNVAITEPQLFNGIPSTLVAYAASGLLQNNGSSLASGLGVNMLGTSATIYNVRPYAQQFIALDVLVANTTGPGPKHLVFSTPNDLYVRPSAFTVVTNRPPSVTSATATFDSSGNRLVSISGTNLQWDTRINFDGIPGTVQGTTNDGRLLVAPPPAPGGYTATVVALNSSDPQSSLFLQPTPLTYTYDPAPGLTLTVSPQFLTPGADTQVDIVSQNANFVDGQVFAGFGNADIVVKKVNVVSSSHVTLTVAAPSSAIVPTSSLNLTNGLRILSPALGTPIVPPAQ